MDDQPEGSEQEAMAAANDKEDHFLRSLADLANGGMPGLRITVTLGGMLISGQLTSNVAFFNYLKEIFDQMAPKPQKDGQQEARKNVLADFAEQMAQTMQERNQAFFSEEETDYLPTAYLHLRDVRYLVPGSPPFKSDFWRGRIDQISGFTIGQMVEQE
ncbi:MAG: hypothetical protein EOQ55_24895 [Mesorhizobium sp.]|uniref:hypothetical protein n=1 Tax=Mesorhizobium sp. TaxID=1871066 RepID=UPI000FE6B107|nr:hypothetical protein [Mesorhizobium sp.]RWG13739.1 MAG: hypothetical protein EOQ55_24895 [Mesorhizobium sp.]